MLWYTGVPGVPDDPQAEGECIIYLRLTKLVATLCRPPFPSGKFNLGIDINVSDFLGLLGYPVWVLDVNQSLHPLGLLELQGEGEERGRACS